MAGAPKSDRGPGSGGARPGTGGAKRGAGRPKGSASKKTLEIANRAAELGITPLEVMLSVMRDAYAGKDYEKALDAATRAAPYMHSKLSSVDLKTTIKKTAAEFTRDELLAIAAIARSGGDGSAEAGRRQGEPDSVH
jgi:hypothetical protein